MKILWFGDIGRTTSFSRISESVLPYLSTLAAEGCYVLGPPKNMLTKSLGNLTDLGCTIYHIGDPIYDLGLSWETFLSSSNLDESELSLNMKYSLFQASHYCNYESIDYMIFVIGIYEVDWFMSLYRSVREYVPKTKIAVWCPIDYIPNYSLLENIIHADRIYTMTTQMENIVYDIVKSDLPRNKISTLPHAISSIFMSSGSKKKAFKYLSQHRKLYSGKKLKLDDIVLLNANNYVPRKQIDLTIGAFCQFCVENPTITGIKLWLHTNTENTEFKKLIGSYCKKYSFLEDSLILSMNNLQDQELAYIYKYCDIGIQTSNGEGWSLTNCEHAISGAPQIVPNFLATGVHFGDTPFSYSVGTKQIANEKNDMVTVADIQITDIVPKIKQSIDIVKNKSKELFDYRKNIIEYFSQFTWDTVASNLFSSLLQDVSCNSI